MGFQKTIQIFYIEIFKVCHIFIHAIGKLYTKIYYNLLRYRLKGRH